MNILWGHEEQTWRLVCILKKLSTASYLPNPQLYMCKHEKYAKVCAKKYRGRE